MENKMNCPICGGFIGNDGHCENCATTLVLAIEDTAKDAAKDLMRLNAVKKTNNKEEQSLKPHSSKTSRSSAKKTDGPRTCSAPRKPKTTKTTGTTKKNPEVTVTNVAENKSTDIRKRSEAKTYEYLIDSTYENTSTNPQITFPDGEIAESFTKEGSSTHLSETPVKPLNNTSSRQEKSLLDNETFTTVVLNLIVAAICFLAGGHWIAAITGVIVCFFGCILDFPESLVFIFPVISALFSRIEPLGCVYVSPFLIIIGLIARKIRGV